MIAPDSKRQAVRQAVEALDVSERKACQVIGQPIVTVIQLQEGIGLNYFVTAQRYVDRLIDLGILRQLGDRARNRLFIAGEIMQAIEKK